MGGSRVSGATAAASAFSAPARMRLHDSAGGSVRAERRPRPFLTATVTQPGQSAAASSHAQWSPEQKTKGMP